MLPTFVLYISLMKNNGGFMRLRVIFCTLFIVLINISVNSQVNEVIVEKPVLSEGQILIKKGKEALIKGKIKRAVELCEKAVKIEPENSEFYLVLGDTYGAYAQSASVFKKMGLAKKCRKAYIKSIELNGKNLESRFRLMSYYLQAPWIAGGSSKKAKIQAKEISDIDRYKGHFAWAAYYKDQKEPKRVLEEYLKAVKLKPNECDGYLNLGFHYKELKEYKNCEINLLRALQFNSEEILAWYGLGTNSLDSGMNLAEGLKYFDKFLSYKSEKYKIYESYAYWRKGLIYEKLTNKRDAEKEYRRALKIKPDNKEAKKALKKLLD